METNKLQDLLGIKGFLAQVRVGYSATDDLFMMLKRWEDTIDDLITPKPGFDRGKPK